MKLKNKNSSKRFFMFYLMLTSLSFLGLVLRFKPLFLFNPMITSPSIIEIHYSLPVVPVNRNPRWLRLIKNYLPDQKKIRVGLLNIAENERESYEATGTSILENVHVLLDPLPKNLTWENLFPVWIDEDHTWNTPTCPEVPLPQVEGTAADVDVVVVKTPCDGFSESKGLRDVFRLQVNLAAAKLVVESGRRNVDRTVYVVFIGSCEPMHEIFRCDERVRRVGKYWVYRPNLKKLKQKLLMPVGSCQIAPPVTELDQETWRRQKNESLSSTTTLSSFPAQRVAYVTLLHSSESYVCGAIALAQSIRQSGSRHDMILLHDDSIKNKSRIGLSLAGWKLRRVERISSPFSEKGSYNEWNYSKLRVWQVTDYDKLVFIDADFIIAKNVDYLFFYPQLSAAGNNRVLFNSGVMVLEPSACLFEELMQQSFKIKSYNGGDQGFLNEYFVWWHRLSKRVNTMKYFGEETNIGPKRNLPNNLEGIHYLGIKPWRCYRDYDCNWDLTTRRVYASESVNKKWWKVYDKIPKKLQRYCGLTRKMDKNIEKWMKAAKVKGFPEKHWRLQVGDPRKKNLVD
ncbi:PREDICTED: putative UDP-glucuronate:xylan alpha-glucuronosyltransferase 5 isoform X1 [Brassica oleracea var. oleracea]|uniref:putative UDP-glucuronate:xylan alpha-glucuronosyltransferase 5 isoform X1 n=1 Tax=Brassica oleracea var. oleracea TaxID=109376 RepID=UPI0006A6CD8C|nr:PREDICTED: putative UDP-glucuronate:xylan alpha-glucuronosyltransferase 5 isoform X1 [Brassica oleracea var. oleracea]